MVVRTSGRGKSIGGDVAWVRNRKSAQEAADRAKRMMRSPAYSRQIEDLTIVTGTDEKPKAKAKAAH